MDSIWEQKSIFNELTQGMEVAKQLKIHLNSTSSHAEKECLVQKLLSSYDKALWILKWSDTSGQPPAVPHGLPETSASVEESPRSEELTQPSICQHDEKVVSKKRKALAIWTDQVRICTDNGLEGSTDDGYSWRKYGQKDILGARFPRSYYRCTYSNVQNCLARKQVQRTDEDPTVFEVLYRGKHTCHHPAASAPPPEKHHPHQLVPPTSGEMLASLRANLRVNTADLDATVPYSFSFPSSSFGFVDNYQVCDGPLKAYSASFVSPAAATGSNYATEWGTEVQNQNESTLTGTISATTSATNSPLTYQVDLTDLAMNFPFNNSFFSNDP